MVKKTKSETDELIIVRRELALLKQEKDKLATELIIARRTCFSKRRKGKTGC